MQKPSISINDGGWLLCWSIDMSITHGGGLFKRRPLHYRERQEKAENKVIVAAENNWRNLLRSIFTRIKVQGDYSAAAADVSGEPGLSHAPSNLLQLQCRARFWTAHLQCHCDAHALM